MRTLLKSAAILLLATVAATTETNALFADQVGVNDWFRLQLGDVSHARFSQDAIYVATDAGVIAQLNAIDGEPVWRHRVPEPEVPATGKAFADFLLHDQFLFSLSIDGRVVRKWRTSDGGLIWSSTLTNPETNIDAKTKNLSASSTPTLLMTSRAHLIVVGQGGHTHLLETDDGSSLHRISDALTAKLGPQHAVHTAISISANNKFALIGLVAGDTENGNGVFTVTFIVKDNGSFKLESSDVTLLATADLTTTSIVPLSLASPSAATAKTQAGAAVLAENTLVVLNLDAPWQVSTELSTLIAKFSATDSPVFLAPRSASDLSPYVELRTSAKVIGLLHATSAPDSSVKPTTASDVLTVVDPSSSGAVAHLRTTNSEVSIVLHHDGMEWNSRVGPKISGGAVGLTWKESESVVLGVDPAPARVFLQLTENGDSSRVLSVLHDGSLVCWNASLREQESHASMMWVRHEALAHVVEAVSVETPPVTLATTSRDALNVLEEGSSMDIMLARLQHQIKSLTPSSSIVLDTLSHIKETVSERGAVFMEALLKGDTAGAMAIVAGAGGGGYSEAAKSKFGFKRILVLLTRVGKLFGVDADTGNVLWGIALHGLTEGTNDGGPQHLTVVRAREVGSYHPQVLVCNSLRQAVWVNAVTGEVDDAAPLSSSSPAILRVLAPLSAAHNPQHHEEHHLPTPLLVVHQDLSVSVLPLAQQAQVANSLREQKKMNANALTSVFRIDKQRNSVTGYRLVTEERDVMNARVMWTHQFPPHSEIANMAVRDACDVVNSPALPLADGSVMVKYLNPHLVAIATTPRSDVDSEANPNVDGVVVYLIDVVSGSVVHRVAHPSATGPVHMVAMENWLVYTLWNDRSKRTQVSSISLYERALDKRVLNPWSSSAGIIGEPTFSSFQVGDQEPIIMQKTFAFGAGVRGLGATCTAHGITSKNVLMVLDSGQVYAMDRRMLDPRRPQGALTPEQQQQGLFAYHPEIPIVPTWLLTYGRAVEVTSVISMPARLESTTLVFAFGLDMFYTRRTPSLPFDLLAEDFSYFLLLAMLVGLFVGVMFMSSAVKSKHLFEQWK